jgi:D-alanyl-D-alanine carboxypeptidase
MTCICTIELFAKYKMTLSKTYFKVTEWSADMKGTSAKLVANSWLSILDLLHGLMLPSGNDAAMVLAENMGAVIYFDKAGNQELIEGSLFSI